MSDDKKLLPLDNEHGRETICSDVVLIKNVLAVSSSEL